VSTYICRSALVYVILSFPTRRSSDLAAAAVDHRQRSFDCLAGAPRWVRCRPLDGGALRAKGLVAVDGLRVKEAGQAGVFECGLALLGDDLAIEAGLATGMAGCTAAGLADEHDYAVLIAVCAQFDHFLQFA